MQNVSQTSVRVDPTALGHTLRDLYRACIPSLRNRLHADAARVGCAPEDVTYSLVMLDRDGAEHPLSLDEFEAHTRAGTTAILDIQVRTPEALRRDTAGFPPGLCAALYAPRWTGCVRVSVHGFGLAFVHDLSVSP